MLPARDFQHNSNATSVMYSLDLEGLEWLDTTDLAELAKHHMLRIASHRDKFIVEVPMGAVHFPHSW
jgi:hypothetical protein